MSSSSTDVSSGNVRVTKSSEKNSKWQKETERQISGQVGKFLM